MSKWILILLAALVVGAVCWVGGSHVWHVLTEMHGR